MSPKIIYIERKYWKKGSYAFSIENVFEQVGKNIERMGFDVEFQKIPFGNGFLEILGNLLLFRKKKADIFHITGQTHYMALVLPPKKTVLTIHDLGFLQTRKGIRGLLIRKLFFDWPLKRLNYITVVSKATEREILENYQNELPDIRIIENPLKETFRPHKKKEFNKKCPTILQIGITPNKNIPNLLRALTGLPCTLRIIGKPDSALMSELMQSSVKFEIAYGLDDEALRTEYENADIVTFCSVYEGFGLPIIEAQAMGKPLITSDLSPLREVAGRGAVLIDPYKSSEIRSGIQKIIEDDHLRNHLIEEGTRNIARFRPAEISEKYIKLYEQILSLHKIKSVR